MELSPSSYSVTSVATTIVPHQARLALEDNIGTFLVLEQGGYLLLE